MLTVYMALELVREREAELAREMEMLRLAGPGPISRGLRRLVAALAIRPDREAGPSRLTGGRIQPAQPSQGGRPAGSWRP